MTFDFDISPRMNRGCFSIAQFLNRIGCAYGGALYMIIRLAYVHMGKKPPGPKTPTVQPGSPCSFEHFFQASYANTALATPETVMHFIKSIGHERILFGSDIPFGTTEPHEIRRSMIDLSLEGFLSGVMHSSMAKAVVVCVGGWNGNWKKFSLHQ